MSIVTTEELADFRAEAESRMVDSCTITLPGAGAPVFNEETGQYDDPAPVTVYTGRCEVQIEAQVSVGSSSATATGALTTRQQLVVKLPVVGSEAVRIGATVTLGPGANDAALTGRQLQVIDLHFKTYATARRLLCNTVTGG